MPGPMGMYLIVHDAIEREVIRIEQMAHEAGSTSVSELKQRVEFLELFCRYHERAEEEVLFPALEERYPKVAASYEFDHDHYGPNVFEVLLGAIGELEGAVGNGELQAAAMVRRTAIALNEHMRLHIAKENALLVPVLETEFDVGEQAGIAARMGQIAPPPLMLDGMSWIYRMRDQAGRKELVATLHGALPPPVFQMISERLAREDPAFVVPA